MDRQPSIVRLVASALLGVIAVGGLVFALVMFLTAWVTGSAVGGTVGEFGMVGAIVIGVLTIVFAALAAVAARDSWVGRSRGRLLGLIVGIITALGGVMGIIYSNAGDATIPLYVAVALGLATCIAVLLPAEGRTTGT